MGNVKNVLSIDMDYIMNPTIGLYNDWVSFGEYKTMKPEEFWQALYKKIDMEPHLEYDKEALLYIVKTFSRAIASLPKDAIYFSLEHDGILNFLCADEKKIGETYEIYNIDHHHDIYYGQEQKDLIDRFDYTDPANWVYYLGKNKKIEEYHWLRGSNSVPFELEGVLDLYFPIDMETPKEEIDNIKFDYVFVCCSKFFYPPKFTQFFDMLKLIAEGTKGCCFEVDEERYCKDGKSRLPLE